MRLATIEVAGFRGVKQKLAVTCPSGFLVIVGRNGSGKSTICDAIEFCLTGSIRDSSHKEKGETIADYLWWRGRGSASERFVRVTFVDDKGVPWVVTRTPEGLEGNSQAALEHLYRKEVAPNDPVVGLCRTSIIRDEEITSLSVDLPEGDRYRFVRDALGTVDMSQLEGRLDKVKGLLEARMVKEQPIYQRCRDQVADLTARLSDARVTAASLPESHDAEKTLRQLLNLQDADTQTVLESGRQSLAQGRVQIDRLHRLYASVQELSQRRPEIEDESYGRRTAELESQLVDQERMVADKQVECEQLFQALQSLKQEEPERADRAELLDYGQRIGISPDERCPLCGSTISSHDFGAHISSAKQAIAEQASRIVETVTRHNECTKKRELLVQQRDRLKKDHTEHTAKRKALESSIARINQEAIDAGMAMANAQVIEMEQVRHEIEAVRDRMQKLEQALSWLESSRATDIVQTLEADLELAKQQADEAFSTTNRLETAISKCKKATNGVRSLLGEVLDEQLSELSPLIEELYKRLRPHVEWTNISYRLRGDVRRLLSFEVGDGVNPSFVFSSGQRRAAGIAFLLAVHLSRPWCEWKSLVLDDPVQHVDDFRALNLTEVLAAIRKAGRQVVCCVEDEALAQLLCRRLRNSSDYDGGLVEMQYDRENGVIIRKFSSIGPLQSGLLVPA